MLIGCALVSFYHKASILDALIIGENLEYKIAFGNISKYRRLPVSDPGLTHQPAIHIEEVQLIDFAVLSIGGKEQHLLPLIGL